MTLAAAVEGIEKKTDPGDPTDRDLYQMNDEEFSELGIRLLMRTLFSAIEALKADLLARDILGPVMLNSYIGMPQERRMGTLSPGGNRLGSPRVSATLLTWAFEAIMTLAESSAEDITRPRRGQPTLAAHAAASVGCSSSSPDIPASWSITLGILVWVSFFGFWEFAVWQNGPMISCCLALGRSCRRSIRRSLSESFLYDVVVSVTRILVSFALACLVAVPLGILMGSFRTVEAFFNPLVSAWRYLATPAFIPLSGCGLVQAMRKSSHCCFSAWFGSSRR